MATVRDAEVVARTAFAGDWEQLAHTTRVAYALDVSYHDFPVVVAVGWLHDVVEDTVVTLGDLTDLGFGPVTVEAVRLLSREHGSSYPDYKRRILDAASDGGVVARLVKRADAADNLDRCKRATGVPKWAALADERYRPMLAALAGGDELPGRGIEV